eukprot:CAMPEP_0198660526 /NCGR_PEP_ID=MMETSP1467-20131203/37289_1 /TAXON_ID=1462469 /ORGANISM="unid. sp., Strain CCMP2135" /LENGTH=240 /DNA_ID=CAMNT_0044396929 /DNA_START=38 /DNA_END=760 /DNA_ORIENTATION=+
MMIAALMLTNGVVGFTTLQSVSLKSSPWQSSSRLSMRLFSSNNEKETPLINVACGDGGPYGGNVDLVKMLLDRGVSPDGEEGAISPLELACKEDNLELVKLLLDRGADPNGRDPLFSPLDVTCANSYIERAFSRVSLDIERTCARVNVCDIAKLLLESGANPEGRDPEGKRDGSKKQPLHVACRMETIELARILLDGGADPNGKRGPAESPLRQAVKWGHADLVEILLERGADLEGALQS